MMQAYGYLHPRVCALPNAGSRAGSGRDGDGANDSDSYGGLENNSAIQREPKLKLELELELELELGWAPHSMATPISAEAIEPTKIAILAAA